MDREFGPDRVKVWTEGSGQVGVGDESGVNKVTSSGVQGPASICK